MTDIAKLKEEAMQHLRTMPKPTAESSAAQWNAYRDFWTRIETEDTPGQSKLYEDVVALIGKMEKCIKDEYQNEIDMLEIEIGNMKALIEELQT